jgi:hypothetical protein
VKAKENMIRRVVEGEEYYSNINRKDRLDPSSYFILIYLLKNEMEEEGKEYHI